MNPSLLQNYGMAVGGKRHNGPLLSPWPLQLKAVSLYSKVVTGAVCCRMGTHPSGPAVISGQDTTLKEWIQAHPEALGDAVLKRFGPDLPYLFKVSFTLST